MTEYRPLCVLEIARRDIPAPARATVREGFAWMLARFPSALFAIAFGGLLVGFALPRMVAGIEVLPYPDRLVRLAEPGATLAADARSLRRALSVVPSGRGWSALGEIHLERARRLAGDPPTSDVYLDRGIAALHRGVALAPAQPLAWTMLAQAMVVRYGIAADIGPQLRMAIKTAPGQENLLLPRVELGLIGWPRLDDDLRRLVAGQLALAVDRTPVQLARLVRHRYALGRVRRLLAADPTRLRRFDTAYLSLN